MRIVLEVINAILLHGLVRNPELLYALLQRQDLFAPLRQQPRFAELVHNIQVLRGRGALAGVLGGVPSAVGVQRGATTLPVEVAYYYYYYYYYPPPPPPPPPP